MIKGIKVLDILNEYDGLLTGLGLYQKEVCFFSILEDHNWDEDKERIYNVYRLSKEEQISHLIRSLIFRNVHNRHYSGSYSVEIAHENADDFEREAIEFNRPDPTKDQLIGQCSESDFDRIIIRRKQQ